MKVLIITTPLPTASQPNTMAPLARQIQSLRRLGLMVQTLEISGYPKIKYLKAWPSMKRALSSVDLVHGHYGYCGWLARGQFQKPVVVSFMGDDLLGTPKSNGKIKVSSKVIVALDRWLAQSVDTVIVKSPEMARVVQPVNAYVVPNGVDTETFRPLDPIRARAILGWNTGERHVLFPGNPKNPRKGFVFAQQAVKIAEEIIQTPLRLVKLVQVPSDQIPLIMNACESMIFTSFVEGSPNVVKEAMACNLPIISVRVGDVADLLSNVTSCKICPRSPELLGDALASVLKESKRSNGRDEIQRMRLDTTSVAQTIINIYDQTLTRKRI